MIAQRHCRIQRFREQLPVWSATLHANSSGLILGIFKQTAHESPDLNMDFRSFDNGLKQPYG